MHGRLSSEFATKCEHTDRLHHAKGMCGACYMRFHRMISRDLKHDPDYRHPEISLNFTVKNNCILCGDGFNDQHRKGCTLHPEICDTCHAEYCECKVGGRIELTPLEDIAQMKEDSQISILYARKMTLRIAGKRTNSLPRIFVETPLDERSFNDTSR